MKAFLTLVLIILSLIKTFACSFIDAGNVSEAYMGEKLDKSPKKQVAKADDLQEKFHVNKISCECYQFAEKQKGFIPSLMTLKSYESFTKMTDWKYAGDENFYQSIFFKNLQTSSTHGAAIFSFTNISFKPIRLMHPNNTFAINITPCTNENKVIEVPIKIDYKHSIRKYNPTFDYEEFDKTAKSYLDVILNFVEVREEEILNKVLFGDEMIDILPFISSINAKYQTEIKFNSLNEEESIAIILSELQKKDIDFSDFILNEFILSDTSNHIINEDEKIKLENIFRYWLGFFSVDDFDEMIYPQISVIIETRSINIEISENIIRRWNPVKNKPLKDKYGNYITTNILAEIPKLKYSTSDGLNVFIKDVCINRTEIAGTSILLHFTNASLISSLNKSHNLLEYHNYPSFVNDSSFFQGQPMVPPYYNYESDSLLFNFTGLFVESAILNIPYKNKVITTIGMEIFLNNNFISGKFILPTEEFSDSQTIPSKINIVVDESRIETTSDELLQYFKKIGLNDIKFINEEGKLKVHFKKNN